MSEPFIPLGIVVPRRLRRTPTQLLRDELDRRRSSDQPRELRLPFVMPVHGEGSPPAGMFKFVEKQKRS